MKFGLVIGFEIMAEMVEVHVSGSKGARSLMHEHSSLISMVLPLSPAECLRSCLTPVDALMQSLHGNRASKGLSISRMINYLSRGYVVRALISLFHGLILTPQTLTFLLPQTAIHFQALYPAFFKYFTSISTHSLPVLWLLKIIDDGYATVAVAILMYGVAVANNAMWRW